MANKEVVKALLDLLMEDDGAGKIDEEKVAEEKAKREAEAAAKAKADEDAAAAAKAAEEKAKAEAEAAAKAAEGEGGDAGDDKADELKELKRKALKSDIESTLTKKNLDTEYLSELDAFIAYDKMEDEDGNADPEKVEKLVTVLNSIALRKPPAGGVKPYDPNNQGLGKYLKK